ncbi:RNA-directed DNA polymerase [Candidatus Scalindua japonica]|uniref:RNA-directed DNA polymerase n=1 Tax=Candidatus Scalindua japonica TaxID=1284222 RepID=A0A286TZY0_9BACT|nr:RNA-directed DNA polymerase [Candidatus Scalindua japonica]
MDVLIRAWNYVRKNKGSAGIDKVTIQEVEKQGVLKLLFAIQIELAEESDSAEVRRMAYKIVGKKKHLFFCSG